MRVSVIIPSLNSPILDEVLAAVLAQDEAEYIDEILIVGQDAPGLSAGVERARLIDPGHRLNPPAARNLGIRHSAAPLLLFLDADCIPQPGWLRAHRAAHAAHQPVVGGGVLPRGENYWSLAYNLGMFHEYLTTQPDGRRDILPTLNLSVERRVIDEAGWLDETLPRAEDLEWSARLRAAGVPLHFCAAAAVVHRHRRLNARAVWDDCAGSGYFSRQVRLRYPQQLKAPGLLERPRLVRLLSPAIAAWATLRAVAHQPVLLGRYPAHLPAIYMTKLAWAWGAGAPA